MHSFFERTTFFITNQLLREKWFHSEKSKQWTNDIGSFRDMKKTSVF